MIGLLATLFVYLTTLEGTSFEIVNRQGDVVENSGLLLYKGGTVCDDGFDENTANAICNLMGYASTGSEWSSGRKWTIQDNYRNKLDAVKCRSNSWSSCTISLSYYKDCSHSENVFLTCDGTDPVSEFTIVDRNGDEGSSSGLLLYKSGTVCDDGFNQNAADAICSLLGYLATGSEWTSGSEIWSIQSTYSITLDDVNCQNNFWSGCTYSEYDNCGHSEDVFLTCSGSFSGNFRLVDMMGRTANNTGLLLYKNGTVCNDDFDDNAANAFCSLMGYAASASEWTSASKWSIQSDYSINMDNVNCRTSSWSSCTYSESHNCGHGEDVFLTCSDQDSCAEHETLCLDGTKCISTSLVCDDYEDCFDGSDESNCMAKDQGRCAEHETLCQDGTQCISTSFVCDEYEDCFDGSDESNCMVKGGLSAGGIVGIIAAALAVIFGVFLCRKGKRNQFESQQSWMEQSSENNEQTTVPAPNIPTGPGQVNTGPDVSAMSALGINNLAPPSYTHAASLSEHGEDKVPTYEEVMANEQTYVVAHIYDGQYYSEPLPAPPESIDTVEEGGNM